MIRVSTFGVISGAIVALALFADEASAKPRERWTETHSFSQSSTVLHLPNRRAGKSSYEVTKVGLTFQKIETSNVIGKTSATDSLTTSTGNSSGKKRRK
jgi:hypothetical protein